MRIVSWNWFWYVLLGFIMGGGAVYLTTVFKEKCIKPAWHELALTIVSFATFMFMGQTFIASFNEGEPRAAWLTIVFMGLPIVMMAVVIMRSIRARMTKTDSPRRSKKERFEASPAVVTGKQ